jgi:hypothetical protein
VITEASTCACGTAAWHEDLGSYGKWCKRCGATRALGEEKWRLPLDCALNIRGVGTKPSGEFKAIDESLKGPKAASPEDEIPTRPDIIKRRDT